MASGLVIQGVTSAADPNLGSVFGARLSRVS
jgi:hypothetical protein